jgi:hypothetical protein
MEHHYTRGEGGLGIPLPPLSSLCRDIANLAERCSFVRRFRMADPVREFRGEKLVSQYECTASLGAFRLEPLHKPWIFLIANRVSSFTRRIRNGKR